MKYQEIKEATKRATENQKTITIEELEDLLDEITDLCYDANKGIENEISCFLEDADIYGEIKRMISPHSEPGKIRAKIRDLMCEKRQPEKIRKTIEWDL